MQKYIGTKVVEAKPNSNAYHKPGYAVHYADGYASWSPEEAFNEAYRTLDAVTFGGHGHALKTAIVTPLFVAPPGSCGSLTYPPSCSSTRAREIARRLGIGAVRCRYGIVSGVVDSNTLRHGGRRRLMRDGVHCVDGRDTGL